MAAAHALAIFSGNLFLIFTDPENLIFHEGGVPNHCIFRFGLFS